MEGERIVGGLGVIENDFHDRPDLAPNVCAVYTEKDCRCQGIAGALLRRVCGDMKAAGIPTLYLLTDHVGFYERYGWEFFTMAQGLFDKTPARLYIHRSSPKIPPKPHFRIDKLRPERYDGFNSLKQMQ